jgi:hypothetical protein
MVYVCLVLILVLLVKQKPYVILVVMIQNLEIPFLLVHVLKNSMIQDKVVLSVSNHVYFVKKPM